MVKLTAPVTPAWISANERAYQNRQAGRVVTPIAPGVYRCPSSKADGTVYTQRIVNVGQLQATCDCPHGQHAEARGHCWHSAAALAAEVRRVSRPRQSVEEAARKMARFQRG